ncbi:M15 family metallopeptidase [Flavobacterium sp. '19STA2R22 D10 B1']|uniref:M15 family metallopeptidase n=1 Tax=Flavobacterium aerium TaxID=3037261 RepID=UPI00278C1A4F|nr:M15 family metallopeptidase [Flavobacterium sp. '19STA2R22 D10 B1']
MKNLIIISFVFLTAYTSKGQSHTKQNKNSPVKTVPKKFLDINNVNDTTFVNLKNYNDDFIYDMKYATTDNFLKTAVYDCAECYLRAKTVKALIKANKDFLDKGYLIKIWDCYRPLDVQKRMWEIVPHTNYVASPTKGSIHNRGGAVDITLVNSDGYEVDMGTPFDYFDIKAHHDYKGLAKDILLRRKLLKEIMQQNGFTLISTEWWHYDLIGSKNNKISNFKWDCK